MSACYLSEEVKTKLSEIQKEQHNVALILRCNKNSKEVVVDQILEDVGAEEIGNALPDSSPRFLVVRYLIALDSARQQPTLALIHFNPLDTEVPIKMMYQATKPLILQELKGVKEFYLTNTSDFTPEYFSHKVIGLTGKPSDQLVPEEARFNADSRRMSSK